MGLFFNKSYFFNYPTILKAVTTQILQQLANDKTGFKMSVAWLKGPVIL